jgi:hypothetical protein
MTESATCNDTSHRLVLREDLLSIPVRASERNAEYELVRDTMRLGTSPNSRVATSARQAVAAIGAPACPSASTRGNCGGADNAYDPQQGDRDDEPDQRASDTEQRVLDQEETRDLRVARSDGTSNRDFAGAAEQPHEHEIADVHARQNQEQCNRDRQCSNGPRSPGRQAEQVASGRSTTVTERSTRPPSCSCGSGDGGTLPLGAPFRC